MAFEKLQEKWSNPCINDWIHRNANFPLKRPFYIYHPHKYLLANNHDEGLTSKNI